MNMCHVKLRGFPDWQRQLPQTLVMNMDTSCLQRCDKGVQPMSIKFRSPDHRHLGCFTKKKERKCGLRNKSIAFYTSSYGDIYSGLRSLRISDIEAPTLVQWKVSHVS